METTPEPIDQWEEPIDPLAVTDVHAAGGPKLIAGGQA